MNASQQPSRGTRGVSRAVLAASALAFVAAAAVAAYLMSSGLPATGASASPRERPGAFMSRTVAQIVSDDYATAWDALYPRHKEVAPKGEYVACELQTPVGWQVGAAKILRVAKQLRRIPGESDRVSVELVTLRLTITKPAPRVKSVFVHTFTAVADGDHWAWILTPSKYELYRSDGCGV